MKILKILISTSSLLAIVSTNSFALERVEKRNFYRDEFDPYEYPQSLANFRERERLRKLAEAQQQAPTVTPVIAPEPEMPAPQYMQQTTRNIAPDANSIYSEPSLQVRRPANVQGPNPIMQMQSNYMATPVMTQQAALMPTTTPPAATQAAIAAPAYRGDLETVQKEMDSDLFAPGVTLTPKVGTQGIGLELGTGFNKYLGARVGANYASYSDSQEVNGKDYDYDITILNGNALLDIHPFANGFRLTGGAYYNPDEVEISYTPTGATTIGNNTYIPSAVGRVDGKIETGDISPYAGIGFSRAFTKAGDWFFDADAGVKFNDLSSTIRSNGTLATDPTFNADLQREKQKVQDEFDMLEYYPVISIGFGYKF